MKEQKYKLNWFLFVVLSVGFIRTLWADDASVFEQKFNAIQTMQATFRQVVFSKARAQNVSTGSMALNRPGQFRWETKEPMSQIVIADGTRLWVYDALLEQVTIRKQATLSDSSAGLFLSQGHAKVASSYRVQQTQKDTYTQFDLYAKSSQTDFKHVTFQFLQNKLVSLELYDSLGQHTQITFKKIQINAPIKSNLFNFKPPKGVDVIDEEASRA